MPPIRGLPGYVRGRLRRLREFSTLEFSAWVPPWSGLRRTTRPAEHLRRLAAEVVWTQLDSRSDRLFLAAASALWPIRSVGLAVAAVRRTGPYVARTYGVSRWRQGRDVVWLANRLNLAPSTYYQFRLWHDPGHALAPLYLQGMDVAILLKYVNDGLDVGVIDDKIRFYRACLDQGIATAPIVATFGGRAGEEWYEGTPGRLPARSLFLKLADGMQGIGAERWLYEPAAATWVRRGVRLDEPGLLAHGRARGRERCVILQHCLENHPDLARFSPGALCTFRIVTTHEPGAGTDVILRVFRMPRGEGDADNFHAQGIGAAFDPETGGLQAAIATDVYEGDFARHPDTGAPILGARPVGLEETTALAVAAHERLPVPWSVGWDVAMTPDGPILVEGNSLWAPLQRAYGQPLGSSAFADRLLDRVLAARGRPRPPAREPEATAAGGRSRP
jgi:Sugar-transfer associated ATP-grasp